jgi:hypothetical protein
MFNIFSPVAWAKYIISFFVPSRYFDQLMAPVSYMLKQFLPDEVVDKYLCPVGFIGACISPALYPTLAAILAVILFIMNTFFPDLLNKVLPKYSTADQKARYQKAKKVNNRRYLDINSCYKPHGLKGKLALVVGGNRGVLGVCRYVWKLILLILTAGVV